MIVEVSLVIMLSVVTKQMATQLGISLSPNGVIGTVSRDTTKIAAPPQTSRPGWVVAPIKNTFVDNSPPVVRSEIMT